MGKFNILRERWFHHFSITLPPSLRSLSKVETKGKIKSKNVVSDFILHIFKIKIGSNEYGERERASVRLRGKHLSVFRPLDKTHLPSREGVKRPVLAVRYKLCRAYSRKEFIGFLFKAGGLNCQFFTSGKHLGGGNTGFRCGFCYLDNIGGY